MARKVIIVGAGLAGTSAAYVLKKNGWQVKLLESGSEIGGRTNSVLKQGYLIDTAASGLSTSYKAYYALAEELGITDEILPASPYLGITRDDVVHEVNMDRLHWSGMFTKLLSLKAKLGLLKLFLHAFTAQARGMLNYNDLGKAAPIDVESTSTYALREFNEEINDFFCDPVVRVMLLVDGDRVSKVEFLSGIANILSQSMSGLVGGQQRFAYLLSDGADIELDSPVTCVRDHGDKVEVSWTGPRGEQTETADACIVASMLHTAVEICPDYRSQLEPLNNRLTYTKALSVSIGASIVVPTKCFMLFVPSKESEHIAAIFLEHNKCPDRAPGGHSLMTAYFEYAQSEACWEMSDEAVVQITLDYLYRIFPTLRGNVDMSHVKRWGPALPLMEIGGYKEVAALNERLDPKARVQFAGDYRSGAGQNTAVDFGMQAANNIVAHHL